MVGWAVLAAALLLASTCASPADDEDEALAPPRVAYVYDDAGRLRAVVDPESETAVYHYDAVGNIVGIDRQSSDALSVLEVTPARATVGDEVVVHGTGFDEDPDDITVTFAGSDTDAEVVEASSLALTVVVPDDASSGVVTVEADEDSVSSRDEIEVGPDRKPAIDDIPEMVATGDTLTIRGENFSPDPLLNAVVFDGATYGTIESSSTEELVVRIPPTATSGRVTVATPDGSVRSDRSLYVVPEPWAADKVGFTARVELGQTTDVAIRAAEPIALVTFRGRRGQHIGVDLGEVAASGNCVGFALRAPGGLEQIVSDNNVGDTEWACGQDPEFPVLPPPLPVTGTYTLVVDGLENVIESLPITLEELSADEWEAQREARAADDEDEGEEGGGQSGEDDSEPGSDDEPGGEDPAGEGESGGEEPGGSEPGTDEPGGDQPGGGEGGGLPPELLEPVPLEPGPTAQGDGPWSGDAQFPVDLSSGLFASRSTDLVVDDVLPLVMGRTYQLTPYGTGEWGFGKGSALDFDIWLEVGSGRRIADLVLPNGMRLPYERTTPGYDEEAAVFEAPSNPTIFNGSHVVWNGAGWDLELVGGTRLVFDDQRRAPLRAVRDPAGNQVVLVREPASPGRADGNVLAVYSPSGRHLSLRYDDRDRVVEARDHLGRTVGYGYDAEDRLVRVAYPGGAELGYGYDDQHRIVTVAGPGGTPLVTNSYDDEDRVVAQVLADGSTYRFAYVTNDEDAIVQTEVTDPLGVVRRVGFAGGYWTTDTLAMGTPSEQSFVAERALQTQLITALAEPGGRRTEYAYDELGSPTAITQAAGTEAALTTEIAYEPDFHQVARVTDPAGRTIEYQYDRRGNRVGEAGPYGETAFAYDAEGRVTSITDPAGGTTEVAYDLLHQVAFTEASGRTQREWLDAAGRTAMVSDPVGRQSRLVYDDLDRLVEVVGSDGGSTSYGFDPLGNLVSHHDANGNTTTYSHDPVGRVVARTDPLGAVDRYGYDLVGNLVSHTDRRGVASTFSYDPLGRQTGVAFGVTPAEAESTIGYSYDLAGRVAEVADSAYGTVRFDYDELDRLVGETTPGGRVDYRYDEAGRRTAMAIEGGPETTYGYDDVGLIEIDQGDLTVAARRDDAGRLASLELPNDVVADYRYDNAGALLGVAYDAGEDDLGSLGYRYDQDGRRVGLTGGLAATALPDPLPNATHDASNRVTSGEMVYDAAGNLLDDGTSTFTWDARGQMVGVAGETSAQFSYDPFGRRTQKTVDGTTTTYRYDGPNIIEQRQGDADPVTYLTGLGVDQVYARRDSPGTVTTYLADGLGSTIGLVDESGEIATRYIRDPHGVTQPRGEDDANPFGFTGREEDETGLHYYRARYYAPEAGRFISEDPLGYAAGDPNLYAYVANDPTNFVDPSGQCIASAVRLFDQTFDLAEDRHVIDDAYIAGNVSVDELQAASDNLLRRAYDNLNDFFVLCDAEIMVYEFVGAMAGALRPAGIGALSRGGLGASRIRPTAGVGTGPSPNLPMRLWDDAPFDGFLFNYRRSETLMPGARIDRLGSTRGRFLAPEGTPLPNRSLPGPAAGPLNRYEVLRPLDVEAGLAAPAFGQPGLGIQYRTPEPVADLIRQGFLKPLDPL